MKGFKRLLSVLLAVIMACTTLCVTSFAATTYYASVSINGGTATKYTTIAKAFAAIEDLSESDTAVITLLRDTSYAGTASLTLSGNVTFDLGGYTLKGTKASIAGVLALDDGAVAVVKNGTITSNSYYGVIYASKQGTLTLEDLTVNNTDTSSTGKAAKRSAAILIEDGKGATVTATNCTFTNKNTYATYSAPVASGPSTSTASYVADCNVTLTNCTISGVVYSMYFSGDDNDATTTIVTVNGTEDKSVSGTLNIAASGVSFTVYDGTYDDENVANYVATGYEIITLGTTSWKVDPIISEITVDASTGGSVDVTVDDEEVSEVAYSETVTITVTPDTGYEITTLTVTGDVSEDEYTVTTNTDGTYSFTMPAEDVTVTVEFALVDYTVTIAECTNGSASIYGSSTTANMGDFVDIITSPNTGYEVDSVTAVGASGTAVTVTKTALNGYRFTMPADDVTVTVTFKLVDYTVTVAETTNGTATVSKTTANYQDEITITVTPADDYEVKKVSVDANYLVVVTPNTDGTYSFTMPADNVTVNVTFKLIDHDVTTTTTSNGSYSTDVSTANTGDTVIITTSPDIGYEVDTITVTGAVSGDTVTVTAGSSGTYTFTMPSEQVSISVTYKMTDYEVAVIETANGEVSVSSDTANYGDVVTITATPEAGYKVGTVTVNGTEISGLTFTMPAEDVEIEVTFVLDDLGLVTEAVTGGTVEVSESLATAQLGDTVTFTVSASAGYTVAGVSISYYNTATGTTEYITDYTYDSSTGTYSFTMPAYAVSITPSYNAIIYTTSETESVTVDHGYYTVSSTTATVGQTVYIYTYPDTVYRVSSITVVDENGNTYTPSLVSSGVYSFTMPASNVTISVIYEQYAPNVTGMIYVNEQYHGYFIDGHLVCIEHTVDENGYCTVCKEYIGVEAEETVAETEIVEETVEIEEPVEDTDTETEVDETEELEVSDVDSEPETNPTTGLSLALLPMAIAVAGAAFGKRK